MKGSELELCTAPYEKAHARWLMLQYVMLRAWRKRCGWFHRLRDRVAGGAAQPVRADYAGQGGEPHRSFDQHPCTGWKEVPADRHRARDRGGTLLRKKEFLCQGLSEAPRPRISLSRSGRARAVAAGGPVCTTIRWPLIAAPSRPATDILDKRYIMPAKV